MMTGSRALADTEFVPMGIKVRQTYIKHMTAMPLIGAPASQFVDNPAALAMLWRTWRNDSVPKVDFAKEIVLVLTAPENAAVKLTAARDDKGNVRITNQSTQRRSLGMSYVIAIVDREGIAAVAGTPVPAPK